MEPDIPMDRGRFWAWGATGLASVLLAWVWAVTAPCATSPWSFPCFVLAVFALGYLPGRALLALLGVAPGSLETLTLSLILGVNLSGGVYFLLAFVGMTRLMVVWPVLAGALLALRPRRTGRWRLRMSADSSHALLVAIMALAVLPLAVLPLYFPNVCSSPSGGLTFSSLPDPVLHLSVANELTHTLPPEVPFLPGTPLRYHYGMDLLAAMFAVVGGLGVPDLTVRFLPVFFQVSTVLAVFCFSRTWLASSRGALVTTLLVLFGEDLSFVPGLLLHSPRPWAASFFFMPNVVSLYLLNPMLPALGLLFGALLCLWALCRTGDRRWLLLTALLVTMLVEYKLFAALQLLLCLGLAGSVHYLLFRNLRLLKVTAAALVLAVPLALGLSSGPGPGVVFELRPWPYVPAALAAIGLGASPFAQRIASLFMGGSVTLMGILGLFLVALPVFLLGTWGLRVIGIPRMLRECTRPRPDSDLRLCLALFVLVGTPLSFLFAVIPSGYPRFSQYNNAAWFLVQSKYLAWLFVVEALMAWSWERARPVRYAVGAAVMGLALPSSIQFFLAARAAPLRPFGAAENGVLAFLNGNARAGDVVYAPVQVAEHVVSLTRCRAPAPTVFPSSFISMADLEQRKQGQALFWSAWREGQVRADILSAHDAAFVVAPRAVPGSAAQAPGVSRAGLVLAYENQGFLVYRVGRDTRPAP